MTRQRSFKRLVRARMEKTGESYTAARAVLLTANGQPAGAEPVPLATSDDEIRRRTGRGWEEWFDLLDEWSAADLSHRELARRVADELGIEPLVWEAQAVTVSYERARGGRAVGQRGDGFAITATKTVGVPIEQLYSAFAEPARRSRWMTDDQLDVRTATAPTSIRFDWGDGTTRVNVVLEAKGAAKATATLEHARLTDAAEADRMKVQWRADLARLKTQLETGAADA